MNSLHRVSSPGRRVFVPLVNVVLLCVLCLIGAAGFAWWGHRSRFTDSARLDRERAVMSNQLHRADLERRRGQEESRLALARTRQAEALTQIQSATNLLGRLLAESAGVQHEALDLKTNETGRSVALHPELVAFARRFYESELRQFPAEGEIRQKLEGLRRLEDQLLAAKGTAYDPDTALFVTTQTSAQWATQGLRRTAELRTLLSTLAQESRVLITTNTVQASSPNLETALQELARTEATTRQGIILRQTTTAQTNAAQTVAEMEAERIMAAAKREIQMIRREIEDAQAELTRLQALKEADERLKNAQTAVIAGQMVDESTRVKLRDKAADPRIQSKLAPFITPGYMDAYGRTMVERKPHSYSVLKSGGALEPTMAGLQKVADLACTRIDKVRPRWSFQKYNSRGWRYNPEEMERVKEAQELLAELGPVLVELGFLEP